jgi:zinc ribbon protein
MPGAGAPPEAGGPPGPVLVGAQAAKLVAPLPAGGQQPGRPEPGPEAPVAPQAVRERTARAAVRQPPTRRLQPGDLVCGECGEGNPPNRKFCSRCGSSLESAAAVKTPWWRKLLPKRKAKVLEAGSRPGRGGVRAKSRRAAALAKVMPTVRKVVAVALVVSGLMYGVLAPVRGWANKRVSAAKHRIDRLINPQFDPVNVNGFSATAQIRGHDAGKAVDGFSNTYWAAPTGGREVVLILRFNHEVDVDKAIVRSGVSANFQSTNRPQNLHIVYSTNATFDTVLKDSPDPQTVSIGNGHGITSMEIHITQMYKAVKSSDVAVTEIELFRKE